MVLKMKLTYLENKKDYIFDNKPYYLGNTSLSHNTIINPIGYGISSKRQFNHFREQIYNENRYNNNFQ